jgi:hypothetical protein
MNSVFPSAINPISAVDFAALRWKRRRVSAPSDLPKHKEDRLHLMRRRMPISVRSWYFDCQKGRKWLNGRMAAALPQPR